MATEKKAPEKAPTRVCPLCSEEYPQEDIYCGKDGTLLVSSDPKALSAGISAIGE